LAFAWFSLDFHAFVDPGDDGESRARLDVGNHDTND